MERLDVRRRKDVGDIFGYERCLDVAQGMLIQLILLEMMLMLQSLSDVIKIHLKVDKNWKVHYLKVQVLIFGTS
jgi:hypothetical protein